MIEIGFGSDLTNDGIIKLANKEVELQFKNKAIEREYNADYLERFIEMLYKSFDVALSNITQNPTKENAEYQLELLYKCNSELNEEDIKLFAFWAFYHLLYVHNLGGSPAMKVMDKFSNDYRNKRKQKTFKWLKGDVELLFKELKASELIESSLESFKKGFNGGDISEVQNFHKFTMNDNLVVYLYNQLDDEGFIDFNNLANNAIIYQLSGVKNAGAKRTNYQNNKNQKPKGSSKIDKIIDTLNQFI